MKIIAWAYYRVLFWQRCLLFPSPFMQRKRICMNCRPTILT